MATGLAALLDDIAVIAKAAAANVDDVALAAGKVSAKAAGVVVDDAAVTPQYVQGVSPKRELPIVWRITLGSLRNKLLLILPAILLLSAFVPWALTPLLMLGGCYLCFEGAEKVWEFVTHRGAETAAVQKGKPDEAALVRGAIRTDLILSAEIMVISMNEVVSESFWNRVFILVVVAIGITFGVYGFVGLLVKLDDIGLALAARESRAAQVSGRFMVLAMPRIMQTISVVGVFAMLWVGGHILLAGAATLGWHAPLELVHGVSHVSHIPAVVWTVETLLSMLAGVVIGGIVFVLVHAVTHSKRGGQHH